MEFILSHEENKTFVTNPIVEERPTRLTDMISIAKSCGIPLSSESPIVCNNPNVSVNVASAEIILPIEDKRPYAPVEIDGKTVLGLLDSGAQMSVLSFRNEQDLKHWNGKVSAADKTITTADGKVHQAFAVIEIPITYNRQSHILPVLAFKANRDRLILGMDFWQRFGVVVTVIQNEPTTIAQFIDPREDFQNHSPHIDEQVNRKPNVRMKITSGKGG